MAPHVTFQGNPLTLKGKEIQIGQPLPAATVVGTDMQDISTTSFAGKVFVVSSIPSLDTPVCATETKHFNSDLSKRSDEIALLTVSMDLPFAQKRWCGSEGVERVVTGSDYKYRSFGEAFGTHIQEWGLLARAVFVFDKSGKAVHAQYVPDIASEPDYVAVWGAVEKALR